MGERVRRWIVRLSLIEMPFLAGFIIFRIGDPLVNLAFFCIAFTANHIRVEAK